MLRVPSCRQCSNLYAMKQERHRTSHCLAGITRNVDAAIGKHARYRRAMWQPQGFLAAGLHLKRRQKTLSTMSRGPFPALSL